MKINMAEIKEKAVGLYKKIGKKTIIIASSVLVIGIAVMLNFILWGAAKDTKKSPAVDLSNLSAVKSGENRLFSTRSRFMTAKTAPKAARMKKRAVRITSRRWCCRELRRGMKRSRC